MTPRTLAAVLFLLPCLLFVRPMPAGEQSDNAKQPSTQKPSLAGIEQSLAEMEAKLVQMTKAVQGLRGELKALAPAGEKMPIIQTIQVYRLNNLNAVQLAQTLGNFLDGKAIRIVPDPQTNSLLIQGDEDHRNVVAALVDRLDSQAAAKPAPKPDEEKKRPR